MSLILKKTPEFMKTHKLIKIPTHKQNFLIITQIIGVENIQVPPRKQKPEDLNPLLKIYSSRGVVIITKLGLKCFNNSFKNNITLIKLKHHFFSDWPKIKIKMKWVIVEIICLKVKCKLNNIVILEVRAILIIVIQ